MRKAILIALVLMLVAGGKSIAGENDSGNQVPAPTQPPSHPAQVSMKAADWNFKLNYVDGEFNYGASANRYLSPLDRADRVGGWSFDFPVLKSTDRSPSLQSLHYEITTASPLLIQGWYVKISGRLPRGMSCHMYFQEVGDNLSGQGQYAYYRWWSTKTVIPSDAFGNFVQFVGLEPRFWSTVMGEPRNFRNWSSFVTGEWGSKSAAATAGFQQALANPQSIGIICDGLHVRGDPLPDQGIFVPGYGYGERAGLRLRAFRWQHRFANDHQFTMDSFAVCDPFRQPRRGPFRDAADTNSAKQEDQACAPPNFTSTP